MDFLLSEEMYFSKCILVLSMKVDFLLSEEMYFSFVTESGFSAVVGDVLLLYDCLTPPRQIVHKK